MAADPLSDLLLVFCQYGNPNVAKAICDFTYPLGICTHDGIRDENVVRAVFTRGQQFESGGAFEIADATIQQRVQGVGELGGLDVGTPAIWICIEQVQCVGHIGRDDIGIEHQSRGKHVLKIRDTVAVVPGEIADH